jgi:hypothetical protein
MDDSFDAFDPERFRLSPEMAAELARAKAELDASKRKGNKPVWLADKIAATSTGAGRPRKSVDDLFVQIPFSAIVHACSVFPDRRWPVLLSIHYRVGRDNRLAVELGNETQAQWGVSRESKREALELLRESGAYVVEQRGRNCPLVTVREDLTILPIRRRFSGS